MPAPDEFADYLRDLLAPLGRIRLRRMFGGYGIYADDVFFAVVVGEQLYFKVDAQSRPQFEAVGLPEWVYEKDGRTAHMNYFRPPEDIFDDEDSLRLWGRRALEAALRSRKPKPAGARQKATRQKATREKAAGKSGKARPGKQHD